MKNCDYYVALMHMYIDGELQDPAELERHLAECRSCKSLYDDYRALADAARALSEDAPETLHSGIMLALAREKKRRKAARFARMALPFAACAAIAAAVLWPGNVKLAQSGGEALLKEMGVQNYGMSLATDTEAATAAAPPEKEAEDAENESVAESRMSVLGAPYECPPVPFSRTFAAYIVAEGDAALMPDLGELEDSVDILPESGEPKYLIAASEPETLAEVLQMLADAGFAIHESLTGAPAPDLDADSCLIILASPAQ